MTNKEQVEALSLKIEEGVKDFFTSDKYKSYLNIMARFRNYRGTIRETGTEAVVEKRGYGING